MSNLNIPPLLGWVTGDSPNRVFSVIPKDETYVAELKNTIKSMQHPKFQDIPANYLDLYSIYVTVDQMEQALKEIDLDKLVKLYPTQTLSQVFTNKYANNACYILVIVPVSVNPLQVQFIAPSKVYHTATTSSSKIKPAMLLHQQLWGNDLDLFLEVLPSSSDLAKFVSQAQVTKLQLQELDYNEEKEDK
ncbi:hypothetical protein BC827DRAFT_1377688 [Russula dissimulans]|nr:hypothetical protein BC827DRAFT_1377688 [Russula dissimulans]